MSACDNPAVEMDALMPHRRKFERSNTCVKCKIKLGKILVRHAVYCKECFLLNVITKFKRSLEPSINPVSHSRKSTLKASGNLIVGFSGGVGSTVLLDLVSRCYFSSRDAIEGEKLKGGKDHPRNASVWPKATICYIEVSNAFPGMRDRTDDIRAVVAQYPSFDFIPLRIENAFDDAWWRTVGGKPAKAELGVDIANEDLILSSLNDTVDPITAMQTYLSSLPTPTAVPSSIQNLIRLLLLHTAKSTNSSHLLLGTSLTSLSINLISSISQGGGFTVREESLEEWTPSTGDHTKMVSPRNRTVRLNRPLRDVGMKECAAWAWWNGLRVISKERRPETKAGIRSLTKEFVVGLEKDYPSTVSTIARTCGKLAPKEGTEGRCILCERPAQHGIQDWKSRISIRSFADSESSVSLPPHLKGEKSLPTPRSLSSSLTPHLCYACHTTLTSRSSRSTAPSNGAHLDNVVPIALPVWARSAIAVKNVEETIKQDDDSEIWESKAMAQADMRTVVANFLLDDE